MTIRHLDHAFAPRSVALIASQRAGSLGALVLSNIVSGGFDGKIFPVNPKYRELAAARAAVRLKPVIAIKPGRHEVRSTFRAWAWAARCCAT